MRVEPRNENVSSDRVLVVKVREAVRENVSTEEVLEGSHEERPIDFPGTIDGPDGEEAVDTTIVERELQRRHWQQG
jgi:hypothetical protein